MLTERENDRLSRVGPGTPMGNVLRRYWHPVATIPDLDREKVLAGESWEDLALYRSDRGEPGLVQQRCPHRSASLAYGIPDEDGLRCPTAGTLTKQVSAWPSHTTILRTRRARLRTRSRLRPTRSRRWVVWSGPTWVRRSRCRLAALGGVRARGRP